MKFGTDTMIHLFRILKGHNLNLCHYCSKSRFCYIHLFFKLLLHADSKYLLFYRFDYLTCVRNKYPGWVESMTKIVLDSRVNKERSKSVGTWRFFFSKEI